MTEPGAVPRWTVANSRKRVVVADLEVGRLAGVFQILRLLADGAVGVRSGCRCRCCVGPQSVT